MTSSFDEDAEAFRGLCHLPKATWWAEGEALRRTQSPALAPRSPRSPRCSSQLTSPAPRGPRGWGAHRLYLTRSVALLSGHGGTRHSEPPLPWGCWSWLCPSPSGRPWISELSSRTSQVLPRHTPLGPCPPSGLCLALRQEGPASDPPAPLQFRLLPQLETRGEMDVQVGIGCGKVERTRPAWQPQWGPSLWEWGLLSQSNLQLPPSWGPEVGV